MTGELVLPTPSFQPAAGTEQFLLDDLEQELLSVLQCSVKHWSCFGFVFNKYFLQSIPDFWYPFGMRTELRERRIPVACSGGCGVL